MSTSRIAVASLLAAWAAGTAVSVSAADGSQWSVDASVALSSKHFNYAEYSQSNRLLDEENGTLPGAVLGFRFRQSDWQFELELAGHSGTVVYDGQTTLGTPVSTQTDTVFGDAVVRAGRRFVHGGAWVLPYAGLGLHYWDRDIRPTRTAGGTYVYGVREIYRWASLDVGARALFDTPLEALRIGFDLRGFRILRPSMEFDGSPLYDRTTLALGARNGWRIGIPVEYALGGSLSLYAEVYAEGWEFGRSETRDLTSNGTLVGTITEPRSETRMQGLTIGLAHRF